MAGEANLKRKEGRKKEGMPCGENALLPCVYLPSLLKPKAPDARSANGCWKEQINERMVVNERGR